MVKKYIAYMTLLFIVILLVIGCSNFLTNESKELIDRQAQFSEKNVKLKVITWTDEKIPMEKIITEFNKKFPNITVECTIISSIDYVDSINKFLANKENIDLICIVSPDMYSQLADNKQLEPLNDFVYRDKFDMSPYGNVINDLTFEGKYYAVPYRNNVFLMYYNKTIFDNAGIPYPTENFTWDDFRKTAKKLTKGSGKDKIWGAFIQAYPYLWTISALQNGKSLLDDDLTPFIDALQFTVDLQNDGSVLTAAQIKEQGLIKGGSVTMFGGNKVAMMPMGEWTAWQLRAMKNRENFQWDVAPMPYPKGGSPNVTIGSSTLMGIYANSKNKEAAWEFLKYYCGEEGACIYAENGSIPGAVTSHVKKIYVGDNTKDPKNIGAFLNSVIEPCMPVFPKSSQLSKLVEEEFQLAMNGIKTPEEAVRAVEKRRKELMK
ncbi:sugar ABC transporter substrate-binding protein [Clostridium sp. SYSU_GA19001]|uniref:ABC transporter substrate-binding protein n=1 Tax=Clostridium caldaquaticum TaxID=2940653 RepID=UPI002076FA65|nr:sugar ABC transporter substrate-binding protein [Clostridium caldaquaticum]MCM8711588.1 sugar ABC transporter substrate-binding protein [Clostridium caldaquaticum]